MKVGFIGFGEAAVCFAQHLASYPDIEQYVYCNGQHNRPPYSSEFKSRLAELRITPRDDLAALVQSSEVIFSAVVASVSEAVGLEAARAVGEGQLFVDVNASNPSAKIKVANDVAKSGGKFVDISLMGAVSLYGHQVPLEASGTGASQFVDLFGPREFKTHVISERAGDAAAMKMLRSIALKGMGGAVVEALIAAERAGLGEEAFHAICDPMDETTFSKWTIMCLLTDGIHAGRRAAEMDGAISFMKDLGENPIMATATLERLRLSESLDFRARYDGRGPVDWHEALSQYVNGQ